MMDHVDEENDSANEHQEDIQQAKKRRLHGACDPCRKRKIRCDSAEKTERCTNCERNNNDCTHDAPRQPTKKEAQRAYIQSLEERVSKMERVLRLLHPDKDIEALLDLPPSVVSESRSSVSDPLNTTASLKSIPELRYPTPHLSHTLLLDESSPDSVNQDPEVDPVEEKQDLAHVELADQLNRLFIEDKRFFGQASSYMFAHYTMHATLEANGGCTQHPLDSKMLRRRLYWELRPWELSFARSQENTFVYPEPELLNSLVALYFEKSNFLMPVLHRPTFLRSLASGLHLRDSGFGMTVLLVCAIASRFTSDTRVLLDEDISSLSSGWKYYSQVPTFRNRLFERSTLYDLQCYALSTVYLLGTSMIHVAWPMLGLGLRFAQEKGVHRRKGMQGHTVEDELEKRVFWSLVCIDRWMSAFLGRPCAIQDEEFDLEYPVECDDEYWETPDPKDAFQQPSGKPSQITYFIWTLKLAEILGFALRTLYATKKSKMLFGLVGSEWESQVVSELDSSMNKWKDGLPHFLRWNPGNPDATFFSQSMALSTCFYHLQIQIHRPFLMKWSPLSLTSLAICNNAARSTAHVLEASLSRGAASFPSIYMSAFAAALVLLLTQQTDSTFDSKTTMELVRKLFHILKDGERKWHMAGRLSDLTQILGCLSDHRSNPHLKRRRETDSIVPHISQSQQNYLWEQTSLAGGTLQRHIAAAKLEPPVPIQTSCVPTNSWNVNNYPAPQIGHTQPSHAQQSFMAGRVDNNLNHPIAQNPDLTSFLANTHFQPSLLGQDAHVPQLLDPSLQVPNFTEDPIISTGLNMPDELIELWANLPLSFSFNEWDDFLSDATFQPQPRFG